MIIDCHGHYTTTPGELEAWRKLQVATLDDPAKAPSKAALKITDDQLRESVEGAQLKLQRERGTDLTIFSPRAIASLLERYPGSRVRIADASYDPLLAQLRSGAIDVMVGALRQPPPVEDVVETALFSEPLSVVVRKGHPLAAARKPSIEMLAQQSWVLPAAGTPTRQHFERIFAEKGLAAPEPAVEASSLIAVRGLLLENDMATLISRHQVRYEEAAGLLEAVKLDLGDTARPIGVTTRADWVPTRLQGEFIAVLRELSRTRA